MNKSRSKVHPNFETRYRITNWAEYDRALRNRGDITLWLTPSAIAAWTPLATGAPGGQRRYSDVAIEAALALRLVFGLPWRQTEGLLRSIISLMGLEHPMTMMTAAMPVVLGILGFTGSWHAVYSCEEGADRCIYVLDESREE